MSSDNSMLANAAARYTKARGVLRRMRDLKNAATCQVLGDTLDARIENLSTRFNLAATQKEALVALSKTADG
ncbi:MAG: hypothetical protein KGQ41_07285, partial [Alphaproteobacteria bacterium]|nr:hypothetical protein [Alphaproteobacteria bacterium]